MSFLERALIAAASLALSVLLIGLLTGFFTTRDRPAVAGASAPGQPITDPAARLPRSAGRQRLARDLRAGDVVLVYSTARPTRRLVGFVASVVGRTTPALAAAGQAVLLAGGLGRGGLIALAWRRMIRVRNAGDPRLRAFVSYWVGRGAGANGP